MGGTVCPFCGCDPFHYVDNGVGMEAVAVTCCEPGVEYFSRSGDIVTLSRGDFEEIGGRLGRLRLIEESLDEVPEGCDGLEAVKALPEVVSALHHILDARGREETQDAYARGSALLDRLTKKGDTDDAA